MNRLEANRQLALASFLQIRNLMKNYTLTAGYKEPQFIMASYSAESDWLHAMRNTALQVLELVEPY